MEKGSLSGPPTSLSLCGREIAEQALLCCGYPPRPPFLWHAGKPSSGIVAEIILL
jgi:hypothetical protein